MKIQLSDHFSYGRLMRYTLPCIGTMIFMSIYSIVDGFFVSNFAGKTPFTAVNLIMPFLMILGTVGFMFGTGGTALVSMTLGKGDKPLANAYFSLIVYVTIGLGILFTILGILCIRPLSIWLGAEGELLECCVSYGRIIIAVLPFFILQMLFQSFFSAAEKPQLSLYVTVSSGVANIVLDAILVTTLPLEYKLIGAAVATAASQVLGGGIPLLYFIRKNTSLLHLGKTRFYGKAIIKTCTNGASEFMSNISMNLVGILFNFQLMAYAGEDGVAAYGVMMYVSMIFISVFVGYSIGSAPVVGFHYGASNRAELKSLLRKSFLITAVFGLAMVISAELLAGILAKIYVGYDEALYAMTVSGFRIFAVSFAFMGFGVYTSGFFTALNDGLTSALISFLRTLIFEVGAVLLLPKIFGLDGIWAAVSVSEILALLLSLAFLAGKRRKYGY